MTFEGCSSNPEDQYPYYLKLLLKKLISWKNQENTFG